MPGPDRPRAEHHLPTVIIGSRQLVAYDPGLALEIVERVAEGASLNAISKEPGLPSRSTFYRWMMLYPDLKSAYDIARQLSAAGLEERSVEIANELAKSDSDTEVKSAFHHDRLKTALSQYRWSAARRDPNAFGDKTQVTAVVPIQINTTLNMDGNGGKTASIYHVEVPSQKPPEPEEEDVVDVEFEVPEGGRENISPAFLTKAPKVPPRHKTAAGIAVTKARYAARGKKKR